MIIQHNMQSLFANGQLNVIDKKKAESAEKLASGYRINRAADDAAGLKISEKMRQQVRGLDRASENIKDGSALVEVADGGLEEIHSIMQRQRELLVQAANDTNTTADRQAIEDELSALSAEFDRIFEDTEFNTIDIFKGKEKILSGPTMTAPTTTNTTSIPGTPTTTNKDVWLPKSPPPDLNPPPTVTSSSTSQTTETYTENERLLDVDDHGHASYVVTEKTSTDTITTTTKTTTQLTYTKINDPDYTDLKKPANMVRSNGYINVQNVKGNLELSCAMSRLGIKIDGNLKSLDLYGASVPKNTVTSPDGNIAETTYDMGDGITITQKIELINNKEYKISYRVENQGTSDHKVDVRLAFDVMNTDATSVDDGVTKSYELKSDFAKIGIGVADADKGVLGNIEDIYYQWDEKVTDGIPVRNNHTGVGYWWEDRNSPIGSVQEFGPITYGPIELLKDPYNELTTVTKDIEIEKKHVDGILSWVYQPKYLDIQAGANAYQNIPIRLWDLSSVRLGVEVPTDVSAFDTDSSLENMDNALAKISSIRSYYGAMFNRLEHAYEVDCNSAENTQAAESRIRDLDMAEEMVEFSKNSILSQSAESMLAQSNQSMSRVMELLQ